MTQNFKGDLTELKMQAVGNPVMDLVSASLDQFYSEGFDSNAWLLTLYDEGRMPFSKRIKREAFLQFIRAAFTNFPVIGTFDSYLFILLALFGADSDITFTVPAAGKLDIAINAYSEVSFDFLVRDLVDGTYEYSTLATNLSEDIILRGVSGIENEYELGLLFSEIIPAGIYYTFVLNFVVKSFFISQEGSNAFDVLDSFGNQIIFVELGGS